MSITSIENFSNELFYEIFGYLDGCEIHRAFSNLNYHFQELLNSSSLVLKFKFHCSTFNELYMTTYKQLLLNNKHQILSFYLSYSMQNNEFFSSFSIDSSFNRLESLFIIEIPKTILTSLLTNLSALPRLFSLTIDMQWMLSEFDEVYRLIFTLPKLKYIKCSAVSECTIDKLPVATDEQFTTIEYLVINHSCTLNELCTLISYTPQLCHLKVKELSESYSKMEIVLPTSFPNLTYLSIEMCFITFDDLALFIIVSECNLKVLRVIARSEDRDYLDADRWEILISDYLPELENFYLEYNQPIDPESGTLSDFEPPEAFTSLFWNERRWVLEVEMDSYDIVYSVRLYKERWYDVDSSSELSQSTRLTITDLPRDECMFSLGLIIRDILIETQINHLEISKKPIVANILMAITHKLSALESLKISSLILPPSEDSSVENVNLRFKSNKNNITNVYLNKINGMEDVYFLLRLCPRMTHLKVDLINDIDYEIFLKGLPMKINNDRNQYFRSLCLHLPTANNQITEIIRKMIQREKLLRRFKIKCVLDDIYLQWK